jgi:hypothetical protein
LKDVRALPVRPFCISPVDPLAENTTGDPDRARWRDHSQVTV